MVDRKEIAIANAQRFGAYLADLRSKKDLSQTMAAQTASRATGPARLSVTQASLARLELGQTAPRPETLLALAELYGEPFDRMVSAYVSIVMFGQEVPDYFKTPRAGVSDDRPLESHPFFASNRLEAWSLDEILAWESSLSVGSGPPELWIISTHFADHKDRRISDIIIDLLATGGNITYFIKHGEIGYGSSSDLLLNTVIKGLRAKSELQHPGTIGEIGLYGLNAAEQAMFTSSLVIGNPSHFDDMRNLPCGFTIVAAAGEHQFGIPLLHHEAKEVVERVRVQIQLRESSGNTEYGIWNPNALTTHPLFKREFDHG